MEPKRSIPAIPKRLSQFASLIMLGALTACTLTTTRADSGYMPLGSQGADERFETSAGRAPTINTLYSMATICVIQGRDSEAEIILNKLVHDYPDFAAAYSELAALYLRNDMTDSAVEILLLGLERMPTEPVLLSNLGMCYILQEQYSQALERFTQASAANSRDARHRANMAVALGMLGRLDEALALYMQIVSPLDAHYNLGVICDARGDHERAALEYQLARVR